MKTMLVCIAAAALCISGCGKDAKQGEPIKALKSSEPLIASNYGPSFWHDQYQRKTELWREAFDYCNEPDRRETQNCEIVHSLTQQPPALSSSPVPYITSPIPSGLRAGLPAPKPVAPPKP